VKRLFLFVLTATVLAGGATPAFADGKRYAVIVQGASGDPQYATLHRGWVDSLASLLKSQFKIEGPALSILVETPKDGELRSTSESVKTVFGRLAKETKAEDLVFVMLIGHGSGDAAAAKFNLIGPDMTAEEWAAVLKPVPARIAFVDSTSSSFPFLAGLAGPNRIVITATSTYSQRYHTIFPDAFIRAMAASEADADKNGRISVMEAFTYASRLVTQHYEQAGTMATERASIDDNGDGKGRDATASGDDGNVASFTYLALSTIPTVSDPEVQQLLVRQQTLTEQVDELRRRKATMSAADFDREFEKVIIDLALVSRDIRRRTGKEGR
jgi:hypothetical protein